jgi:hypothetical protein
MAQKLNVTQKWQFFKNKPISIGSQIAVRARNGFQPFLAVTTCKKMNCKINSHHVLVSVTW